MGKFVEIDDIRGRYEGDFPTEYTKPDGWIDLRISDVESALMGQVPSLRKTVAEINVDSAAVGDPDRINRVKTLVCEKILDLHRNPLGASSRSIATPDITTTDSFGYFQDRTRGKIAFTSGELDSVKLRKNRSNFGTISVAPWRPARDLRY